MENMLYLPFVLRTAAMETLHETHAEHFGMKFFCIMFGGYILTA